FALCIGNRSCINGVMVVACSASSVREPFLVPFLHRSGREYMVLREGPWLGCSRAQHGGDAIFLHSAIPYLDFAPTRCTVFSHICCLSSNHKLADFMAKTD